MLDIPSRDVVRTAVVLTSHTLLWPGSIEVPDTTVSQHSLVLQDRARQPGVENPAPHPRLAVAVYSAHLDQIRVRNR